MLEVITTGSWDTSTPGHVRDCGARAIAALMVRRPEHVRAHLFSTFGTYCITGKQMRSYLASWTSPSYRWVATSKFEEIPDTALVVTRRGFYPVVHGVAQNRIGAPICGYYTPAS